MKRVRIVSSGVTRLILGVAFLAATASTTATRQVVAEPTVAGIYRGVSTAVHFDVSRPLRELAELTPVSRGPAREIPELPTGLEGPLGPQDRDPVVQSEAGPDGEIPSPIISFDALDNLSNVSPPDPVGDVGPNHYVVMSNLSFAIYSKAGALLAGPFPNNSLWSGFGGPCEIQNAGDPIVLHDQLADRWILTQFTSSGPTYFNCVAVSTGPNPTGTYFRYAFSTGPNFPDYPKYGVWPDALYISTREFLNGSSFAGVGAYAIKRADLLAGNPAAQVISFLVPPGATPYNVGDGLLPADLDGTTPPPAGSPNYFVGSMDDGGPYGAPQDALTLWKFTANFANPPSSTFTLANTIPVAPFDSIFPCSPSSRNCIPQPATTNKIDILSYRQRPTWRLAYRNFGSHQSLVTNQSVEAMPNIAGVRWWEIRSPNSSPVIFQQGTYAPDDGTHRWMGSIAMDKTGNAALGFSVSNTTLFPGVRYTGRLVSDPPGTLPQGEATIVVGTGSQTVSPRWGDYTSMNVDPVDDCTFWYINEYVPVTSSNGWRLRVGAFKFADCGTPPGQPDLVETAVSNPPAAAARGQKFSIQDTVQNQGTAAAAATTTRYYLSTDTVRNAGDKRLGGKRLIPGLAAGATSTGSKMVTVKAATPLGSYFVLACADDFKVVAESNETNQCIASATKVTVTP